MVSVSRAERGGDGLTLHPGGGMWSAGDVLGERICYKCAAEKAPLISLLLIAAARPTPGVSGCVVSPMCLGQYWGVISSEGRTVTRVDPRWSKMEEEGRKTMATVEELSGRAPTKKASPTSRSGACPTSDREHKQRPSSYLA
ncbi:hypothetical protein GN956_G15710 [Arapaima gigas]